MDFENMDEKCSVFSEFKHNITEINTIPSESESNIVTTPLLQQEFIITAEDMMEPDDSENNVILEVHELPVCILLSIKNCF